MITGYCYVVGDVLHVGHILHFRNCKALCDKLICGVLTEEAIIEKKAKPLLNFDERVELIKSIKYVDVVVAQYKYSPTDNCTMLKPDILFESSSHSEFGNNENRKIMIMPYYPGHSSTEIKSRIKNGN
jgi:cytidyltransferase-like protein